MSFFLSHFHRFDFHHFKACECMSTCYIISLCFYCAIDCKCMIHVSFHHKYELLTFVILMFYVQIVSYLTSFSLSCYLVETFQYVPFHPLYNNISDIYCQRSSLIYQTLCNIFTKYSNTPPLNSYSFMLYPVCFILFVINLISLILSAFSIIQDISYLVWSKSMQRSSYALDFCVDYYFKSSIPQDVDIQLGRHVPRSKIKWKIFQKKSCMSLRTLLILCRCIFYIPYIAYTISINELLQIIQKNQLCKFIFFHFDL